MSKTWLCRARKRLTSLLHGRGYSLGLGLLIAHHETPCRSREARTRTFQVKSCTVRRVRSVGVDGEATQMKRNREGSVGRQVLDHAVRMPAAASRPSSST